MNSFTSNSDVSAQMHEHCGRYLLIFLLVLALGALPLIGNYVLLERSGEYLPLREIVARQREHAGPCLYGSAVHSDFFHYKLEGYRQTKPKIAAVGSSRVMQLRQSYFTEPFYNLGGGITSVDGAEHLIREMLRDHRPDHLIVGLDYWWFLEESRQPVKTPKPPEEKPRRHLSSVALPFTWLWEGRLNLREYTNLLLHGTQARGTCAIGVRAIINRSGFGSDGSHYYDPIYRPGTSIKTAERFGRTLEMIRNGEDVYRHRQTVRMDEVERFLTLLGSVKAGGTHVTIFVPPLPPIFQDALEARPQEYAFLQKIFDSFAKTEFSFFNFHDPKTIGTNDCEFVDATHGDHIAFARVVKGMLADPGLQKVIDQETVENTVATGSPPGTQSAMCDPIENPLLKAWTL
ncbi:hypothetical protein HYZ99_02425 [Candidatus Peregrinibacteria bacterium]|nr:hypothetical protein [Candidatus Peregrinibacteria bacterium]